MGGLKLQEQADKLIKLAKQLEIPLILRVSLDPKKAHWVPSRKVKKHKTKFQEFNQSFETFITSGLGIDKIKEQLDLTALIYAGNFFLGIGDTRTAKAFYEKLVFLDRKNEIAWNNLGVLLHMTKDPIRALQYFEKVLELNVTISAARYNRGCVLFDLGRNEEAIEWFQQVLELEPKNTLVWFLYGMAYYRLRDYRAAIKPFQLAIEQRPDYEEALVHLALAFQKIDEYGKSLDPLEKLVKIKNNEPKILAQLGDIYMKLGLRSKGVSSYSQAAEIYHANEKYEEAQICREKAKNAMKT